MKFRTTLILFGVFVVLLVFVVFFERTVTNVEEEDRFITLTSEDVETIIYKSEDQSITFQQEEEGGWKITEPLEANADRFEVNRLVDDFSDATIERVVEEEPDDLENYGIPRKELHFYPKNTEKSVTILIGMQNPLDNTFFAKREDETRVVLLSSSFKDLLDKNLFDFRQKNIFKFDTNDAERIQLSSVQIQWKALKEGQEWFLQAPVEALANKSKISSILVSLSNLKAIRFVSEEKNEAEMKTYGLDNPDVTVFLSFPGTDQPLILAINKIEDKAYATASPSPKIIEIEAALLSDLEATTEELREKKVSTFFSWEINRLLIQSGELEMNVVKDKEGGWHLGSVTQDAADKEKIQTFIRKIEGLEAEEFIDPPFVLEDYGLDSPQKRITIWEGDEENAREITILIGSIDSEAEKTVVKNAGLDYLFRVDSSFLELFPKDTEAWKVKEEGD